MSILAAVLLCSCRTAKTSVKTDTRDSERTEYRTVHDTITVHDTVYIHEVTVHDEETNTNTTIQFGVNGGTYNAKTGDATNVTGVAVDESRRLQELTETVQSLTSENMTLHSAVDSLTSKVREAQTEQETEPVRMNGVERFFFTSGIVAWCVVVILLIIVAVKIYRKFSSPI